MSKPDLTHVSCRQARSKSFIKIVFLKKNYLSQHLYKSVNVTIYSYLL